jgi:deoxyribodipyrimidine photo-lyase
MTINPLRINNRNRISVPPDGAVIYWISRDQRVTGNWALLHAQSLALARQTPLAVVFTLADSFLGATLRQFGFMLRGLASVG